MAVAERNPDARGTSESLALRRILIATDGAPSARRVVDTGLEIATAEGAAVTFVHVLPPDEWVSGKRLGQIGPAVGEGGSALAAAAEQAEAAGVPYALEEVFGDAVPAIVGLADATDADLLVVGSRGRGSVTAALLGSVSRGVLARAGRPVLVVPDAGGGRAEEVKAS